MDIYPTHRDYRVPKFVEENTIKNATACKAVNDELKIESCYRGLPFPIPKSGNQAMWNHLQGYQALAFHGRAEVWVTPVSGPAVMVTRVNHINDYHYYNPDLPSLAGPEELFLRYLGKDEAPARLAGSQFMMLDPVDQFTLGRRAYFYTAGRRWVKLAANLAYDTPTPYGAGSATMDDSQSFLGALDRFDFALGGKKEKFIYYNNFSFSDPQTCPPEKIVSTHGFPNPDCVRWELHRVWVVKATLKPGKSHLYHKRIFYWDEDGYVAGASESYNANGKLFRFANNILLPFFEAPGAQGAGNVYLDIDSGITVHTAILSGPGGGLEVITTPLPDDMFRPDAMAGAGIR
jgi:hypothetical protein